MDTQPAPMNMPAPSPRHDPDGVGLLAGLSRRHLLDRWQRPPFAATLATLEQQVRETAAGDALTDRLRSHGWCHSLYVTPAVLDAGLIAALSGDPVAVEHVVRQIHKLARLYADPPASFERELGSFRGKPSAYFSNALTALAVRTAADRLPADSLALFLETARTRLIDDRHRPAYFFTHFNAGHNAVTTHVISAAIVALMVGEACGHPDSEAVIQAGIDACEQHLLWGYDEAGVPHEGPMYALVTLEWVFFFADLMKRHGRPDLLQRFDKLQTILDANLLLQLPGWAGILGFDDCRDLVTRHPMPWLPLTARAYKRPRDLAFWWHLRQQRGSWKWSRHWFTALELLWWDGTEPQAALDTFDLPDTHIGHGKAVAMLRTNWHPDATAVMLLGQGRSHNIPDHVHADAGHFSIVRRGELLAYDTGYFNFDEDTHSVILVDGQMHYSTRQGNPYAGRFAATDRQAMLDYVAVDAGGARGCMWAIRHFLFIRGVGDTAYLVIMDNINRDHNVHRFAWQLQAGMQTDIHITGDRQARIDGQRARIDCHFFNPDANDFPGIPHRLCLSTDRHQHRNISTGDPETHPRLLAEQTGCNATMMAVLIPRDTTQPALRVYDNSAYRTFNVTVEHDQTIDQIVYACDHTFVRLPDLDASSEITVIRRDRSSGRVLDRWTADCRPPARIAEHAPSRDHADVTSAAPQDAVDTSPPALN